MQRLFTPLFYLIASTFLLPSSLQSQNWEEFPAGSGTLPGLFRGHLFDLDLVMEDAGRPPRHEITPSLGTLDGIHPVLYFFSQTSDNRNLLFAVEHTDQGWAALEDTNGGRISPPGDVRWKFFIDRGRLSTGVITNPADPLNPAYRLGVDFSSAPPTSALANLFLADYMADGNGWTPLDGSLDQGGLTQAMTFNEGVFETASAYDTFGRPTVAWRAGENGAGEIFALSYDGQAWGGLAGSDTIPISAQVDDSEYRYPDVTFGGSSGIRPVVAYSELQPSGLEIIRVREFNITSGQWIDRPLPTDKHFGRHPRFSKVPGAATFYLAFENRFDGALTVLWWTGGEWIDMGDPIEPWRLPNNAGLSNAAVFRNPDFTDEPDLPAFDFTVDRFGNQFIVFRAESPINSGQFHIFASYREDRGTEWLPLGDPNDPLGASRLEHPGETLGHYNPAIFVGQGNRPVVAWAAQLTTTPSDETILLRRFDQSVGIQMCRQLAVQGLLGIIESNPGFEESADENADLVFDAGDVQFMRNCIATQ